MPKHYEYCYDWNEVTRAPRDPYDEEAARARHARGEIYTALNGDSLHPHTAVQVCLQKTPWAEVKFLDDQLRVYMTYSFGSADRGRFFLDESWRVEFDDQGKKRSSEVIHFDKDGLLTVIQTDLNSRMAEEFNVRGDLSGNWELIPDFGNYVSIARFDRPTPMAAQQG